MTQVLSKGTKIFTDSQTRHLYATDASMYEELPAGVAFPENEGDIRSIVDEANKKGISITARSAGTSLAGQTTGSGIIVDFSRHMNRILEINAKKKFARVQPGVIRDTLNRHAASHGLMFGPDTATTSRCMLGGMIGNNSCGLFSIKHKTPREHIQEIHAVLSDGSTAIFKPLTNHELEQKKQLDTLEGHIYRSILQLIEQNRDKIIAAYPHPEIIRRNTGYALDRLCQMQPFNPDGRPFNMAELLCGSEGTLAMTTSVKIGLVGTSEHRIVLAPHFNSVDAAMRATVEAINYEPAAVELIDDIILEATKDNIEQRKNRFFLQGDPKCILIIQIEGDSKIEIEQKAEALKAKLKQKDLTTTIPVLYDEQEMNRAWELRKAGLGLLMGLGKKEPTASFCEDTAVRVQDLPAYIQDFYKLLKKFNTHCVFYGHASVGVLHLRPVIDISTSDGMETVKKFSVEIAHLIKKYNGSLSGEHGDGRVRAPYIEIVLGTEMVELLKRVKEIWDPKTIFNPGKIVNPLGIDNDLRTSVNVEKNTPLETQFNWRKEGSFEQALNLCNGAGVCRKLAESGGTMCPSYMATKEEKDSTRGRANLFRQLFSGVNPDAMAPKELHDALDLCISCKGCKSECPANVDMARMKAEFTQSWHEENGVSLSEHFFAQSGRFYSIASRFSNITNWLVSKPLSKELAYRLFNISPQRNLPTFSNEPFMQWLKIYSLSSEDGIRRPSKADARRRVALFVDLFTNYHEPYIARAAYRFLEQRGYEIIVPKLHELGRTQLSKGMLKHAKRTLDNALPKLAGLAAQGIPIIGLEPSEILTLRDEYLDLCDDDQLANAKMVAESSYTFAEFSATILKDEEVASTNTGKEVYIHEHCHTKSIGDSNASAAALEKAGYHVRLLKTGCCGMAGSFGYEANHYDVSMDIGNLTLFPLIKELPDDAIICAPGFSCRHQVMDGTGRKAYHPAELLA